MRLPSTPSPSPLPLALSSALVRVCLCIATGVEGTGQRATGEGEGCVDGFRFRTNSQRLQRLIPGTGHGAAVRILHCCLH